MIRIDVTDNVSERVYGIGLNCDSEGFSVKDSHVEKVYDKEYNKKVYYVLELARQDEMLYLLKYGYDA